MKKRAIGIIGSMGPQASAKFYELLIYHAQKNFKTEKNEDFPNIYLASIPVPNFISDEKRKKEALKMLGDRVKVMDKLSISFFCLACNTGHLLLDELKKYTQKPFVSLLEEVPKFLLSQNIKKIGLLATPTTIKTKLYQGPLTKNGIEVIIPNTEDTKSLGTIISETIAGKNKEHNQKLIQHIARRLLESGAEGILEACTEIPLIFPKQHLVPVFDTLEILAKTALKRYYSKEEL